MGPRGQLATEVPGLQTWRAGDELVSGHRTKIFGYLCTVVGFTLYNIARLNFSDGQMFVSLAYQVLAPALLAKGTRIGALEGTKSPRCG